MGVRFAVAILVFCLAVAAQADEVEVVMATFTKQSNGWDVDTTLRHADTGWEHYADAWRVVTPDGRVLSTRTLYHPHVKEQPFTRGLRAVAIPAGATVVLVEAHDKVHGWSRQPVRVDLTTTSGERYRVKR